MIDPARHKQDMTDVRTWHRRPPWMKDGQEDSVTYFAVQPAGANNRTLGASGASARTKKVTSKSSSGT